MFQPNSAEIEKLKNDLWHARQTIINLTPSPFREILRELQLQTTRESFYRYEHDAIEQIVHLAKPLAETGYLSERANCPLCSRGANSPGPEGFSLNEGLRRHLSGYGNMLPCPVFDTATTLAREHNRKRFEDDDASSLKQKLKSIADRLEIETLYRVRPDGDPMLNDSGLFQPARTADEMDWAEARLVALGFEICEKGRIKSYLYDAGDFIAYADPREKGEIKIRVYAKQLLGKTSVDRPLGSFCFRDSWIHHLREKFESRLAIPMSEFARNGGKVFSFDD